MILIDNYDSFTYNLVHLIKSVSPAVKLEVYRNDDPKLLGIKDFESLVISPGPGTPRDTGYCTQLLAMAVRRKIPVFGVCLGHQLIAEYFGGKVSEAALPVHGKIHQIHHEGKSIFAGVNSPFSATRYHSLCVEILPDILEVTAWTEDGVIMGLAHKELPIAGVQFHPESVTSEFGEELIGNFLRVTY